MARPTYLGMQVLIEGLALAAFANIRDLALVVPNVVAALALAVLLIALELQVRWVEEPYLARAHGPSYRAYAARTGRFVPGAAGSEGAR